MARTTIPLTIDSITDPTPSEIFEKSLIGLLDFGFVENGAFVNVPITSGNCLGTDLNRLYPQEEPDGRYNYQVWRSLRSNWMYETSGISVGSGLNTQVYIDETPTSLGDVSYSNGEIYFNTPISENSIVTAQYNYKWVNFETARNSSFFRQFQLGSLNPPSEQYIGPLSSGVSDIDSESRIQLPCVLVEVSPPRS